MPRLNPKKLDELLKRQLTWVQMQLFEGSILGGTSLLYDLHQYKKSGPYSVARNHLIKTLTRVLEGLTTLDGMIVARCHVNPSKLPQAKDFNGPKSLTDTCEECGGSGEAQKVCVGCNVGLTTANVAPESEESQCKECAKKDRAWERKQKQKKTAKQK